MTNMKLLVLAIASMIFAAGCTLVTDFEDVSSKYDIAEHLMGPVSVTITGDTGSLNLGFDEGLPEVDNDQDLLDLLADNGPIGIFVVNNDSNVEFALVDGQPANGGVDDSGEYTITINDARDVITIQFFNDIDGHHLIVGGDYSARIEVLSNSYFEVDGIPVELEIIGG